MNPWAKEDDIGAYLPSEEVIAMETAKIRETWSDEERLLRMYAPLSRIGKRMPKKVKELSSLEIPMIPFPDCELKDYLYEEEVRDEMLLREAA